MFKKGFGVLQQVGKALMLPVALLPAAGLLLAFGNALQNPQTLNFLPFLSIEWIQAVAKVMEQAGGIIFGNLSLLFAVGVAVGLADGEGVAGLAAIVGYLIMNITIGLLAGVTPELIAGKNPAYAMVLGIPTLQTGVFGGIIIGIIAAQIYKKFYNIELPSYLGFFAGKRFVPIVTAAFALLVGIAMVFVWPPIQFGLTSFSKNMIDTNKVLAAFIFGIIERALIPFGLHHIFYNPFWFQFGEYLNRAGQIVNGDQLIFFAQLKDGVPFTAGTFMTGKFPFMMFGLPAAALAIYHEARPEKKTLVAGIMASAALTSFLTGITEPIEFSFLFVAPILFGIHCIFAGLSFMLMHILNVKIGMTFSGGIIDYLLFGVLPNRTAWWLVIPVGLVFSVIYYFGFRFAIRTWNLKTPGREEETAVETVEGTNLDLAHKVLETLGGANNIKVLDACITRLRVSVKNAALVKKDDFKALGAAGVMEMGNNLQIIFGTKSDNLKEEIRRLMGKSAPENKAKIESIAACDANIHSTIIKAPVSGKVIPLSDVPDATFSQKMLGDGVAIEPINGSFKAPVAGTVVQLFPTQHALTLRTENGLEVLVHVGINTVSMKGKGFRSLVTEGQKVEVGQKLLEVDLEQIKEAGLPIIMPVIIIGVQSMKITTAYEVTSGTDTIIQIEATPS